MNMPSRRRPIFFTIIALIVSGWLGSALENVQTNMEGALQAVSIGSDVVPQSTVGDTPGSFPAGMYLQFSSDSEEGITVTQRQGSDACGL
jgi:hypothetical protein